MTEELTQTREKDEQETRSPQNSQDESNSLITAGNSAKPTWPPNQDALLRHRFKPGQSGNPGGKPKTKLIRDAMTKIGSLDAEQLETYKPKTVIERVTLEIYKTMLNPTRNSAAAVQAFNTAADRIDGKPKPSDEELDSSKNMTVLIGGGLLRRPHTEE
jgi:hypothetical protein